MKATALLVSLLVINIVCALKIDFNRPKNSRDHNTDKYETSNEWLILRRSSVFSIELLDVSLHDIVSFRLVAINALTLEYSDTNEYFIDIFPSDKRDASRWSAWSEDGKTVLINIPHNALVGIYNFTVKTRDSTVVDTQQVVVVLFNPWSVNDDVYFNNTRLLDEYVLGEDGVLWLGSMGGSPSSWTFDQFDKKVLVGSLRLLDHHQNYLIRNETILLSRYLSSMINANNHPAGLMIGRWREPYSGGNPPWYWTGTEEIFSVYLKNEDPVRFAQCWVFAAVMTSVGRSLGIPARPITNFESAHEEPVKGKYYSSIDYLYNSRGSLVDTLGSIWNFHAWTEYWFSRSDDSFPYAEWQVVDATPQEISDEQYQMGPSSKTNVKHRNFDTLYDTDFVISEVDAVKSYYVDYNNGGKPHPYKRGYYLNRVVKDEIGKKISTKLPFSESRDDVTTSYKGLKLLTGRKEFYTNVSDLITFDIHYPDSFPIGESLFIHLNITCKVCSPTNKMNNISIKLFQEITLVSYNGEELYKIKNNFEDFKIRNTNPVIINMNVTREDYQQYLSDYSGLRLATFAKVYDYEVFNGQSYSDTNQIAIDLPELKVNASNIGDTSFDLTIDFVNPLTIPLSNALLRISGSHIIEQDLPQNAIGKDGFHQKVKVFMKGRRIPHMKCFARIITTEIPSIEGSVIL